MKNLIALEEVAMFGLALIGFSFLSFSWWWFLILIFTPDISMIAYLIHPKVGAIFYNIFHHKAVAIALYILGFYLQNPIIQLIGIILFAHASLDRVFGYGLKYFSGFKNTHLGIIGKHI